MLTVKCGCGKCDLCWHAGSLERIKQGRVLMEENNNSGHDREAGQGGEDSATKTDGNGQYLTVLTLQRGPHG